MHLTTSFAAAALGAVAAANSQFPTTQSFAGLTQILPVGIGSSTTKITPASTVVGSAAIVSGVTVIMADNDRVWFFDGNNRVADSGYPTAIYTDGSVSITVVRGSVLGFAGAAATATAATQTSTSDAAATTTIAAATTATTQKGTSGMTTITTSAATATPTTTQTGTSSTAATTTGAAAATTTSSNAGAGVTALAGAKLLGWVGAGAAAAAAIANY